MGKNSKRPIEGRPRSQTQRGKGQNPKNALHGTRSPDFKSILRRLREGATIRQVARELEREREGLARGERQPEPRRSVQELQDLGSEAVDIVRSELRTTKDTRLALQVLRYLGSRNAQVQMPQSSEEERFEKLKRIAAIQLHLVALERHNVYGSSLPEKVVQDLRRLVEDDPTKLT